MQKKKSTKKRNNKQVRKNLFIFSLIAILLIGGLYYIRDIEDQENYEQSLKTNNEPYKLLENRDSIQNIAFIELNVNANILNLSEDFYNDKIFWPYIFQSNPKITNPLDMPKGTVLIIPRVDLALLSLESTENIDKVKAIGDSILDVIQASLKPREFD